MARKPNHQYEKRQRELAKQAKREKKLAKKRAAKMEAQAGESTETSPEQSALNPGSPTTTT